jgi:hypothetical protein
MSHGGSHRLSRRELTNDKLAVPHARRELLSVRKEGHRRESIAGPESQLGKSLESRQVPHSKAVAQFVFGARDQELAVRRERNHVPRLPVKSGTPVTPTGCQVRVSHTRYGPGRRSAPAPVRRERDGNVVPAATDLLPGLGIPKVTPEQLPLARRWASGGTTRSPQGAETS